MSNSRNNFQTLDLFLKLFSYFLGARQIHNHARRRVNKVAASAAERAVKSVRLVPRNPRVVPANAIQRKRPSGESDVKCCVKV